MQAFGNKRHESATRQLPWSGNGISELVRAVVSRELAAPIAFRNEAGKRLKVKLSIRTVLSIHWRFAEEHSRKDTNPTTLSILCLLHKTSLTPTGSSRKSPRPVPWEPISGIAHRPEGAAYLRWFNGALLGLFVRAVEFDLTLSDSGCAKNAKEKNFAATLRLCIFGCAFALWWQLARVGPLPEHRLERPGCGQARVLPPRPAGLHPHLQPQIR